MKYPKKIKTEAPDEFTRLVNNLLNGTLGWNLIQMALRQYVRRSKEIPEGIKDLLAGSGETNAGLIYRMFMPIREVVGTLELAYRRGQDLQRVIRQEKKRRPRSAVR